VTSAQLTNALGSPADLRAALTAACADAAEPTMQLSSAQSEILKVICTNVIHQSINQLITGTM